MRVVGVREPFAMATPDYLEQVVFRAEDGRSAGGARRRGSGSISPPLGHQPDLGDLDLMTVAVATTLALRFRVGVPSERALRLLAFYSIPQRIMFWSTSHGSACSWSFWRDLTGSMAHP
jgi:hypothetical protein